MKRRVATLAAILAVAPLLAGQVARGAPPRPAVPNDSEPFWSWDTRHIAFEREAPGSGVRDVYTVPAARGGESWLGPTLVRGWRPGGGGLLVEYAGGTAVVALGGGPSGGVDGVDATWSPDGGEIAYLRGGALYAANAAGAHERLLATGVRPPSWDVTGPAWSPDGERIAIATTDGLRVVAADGSASRIVFSGENQSVNPAWSPDAATIAFERNAGSHWSIWLVRGDGANPREAIGGAADNRYPQWGPAGRLAFISDREHLPGGATRYRYALYVESPGGVPKKLVEDVRPDSPGRWSTTGAQIAVAAGQECRRWGIYVVRSEGGAARRRTNRCRFEGGPGGDLLRGTPYRDYLFGRAGDDRILAGAGNDTIYAGPGRDRVDCGAGDDSAYVGPGDTVRGCEHVHRS